MIERTAEDVARFDVDMRRIHQTQTRVRAVISDQMTAVTARNALQMIADDMAADAKAFDGQPFNGRTVAAYLGNQGAAIAAIANIVALLLVEP